VDDNDAFLGSAARLLESQGVRIVGTARSGDESMRLARSLEPDIVLVDIDLGAESGFDLATELVEAVPGARVVLISTHSEDEFAELVAASPAAGFLEKGDLGADAIAAFLA
jgi:two-component system, NarL family, nitrate/nitrite response regulator NarL